VETSANVSIFSVTSTSTLYMNAAQAGSYILVKGTAPAESVVKIYLDGVAITTLAETAVTGLWSIAIAESSLGADGVKVLTAKVTEVGLDESLASNSVTFTLDTDAPGFSIAASAATTASGAALDSGIMVRTSGVNPITTLEDDLAITAVPGAWLVYCLGDSTDASNVRVTTPAGVATTYTVSTSSTSGIITGLTTTFAAGFAPGDGVTVTVTSAGVVGAITAAATITFDEDVTAAGMAAGTYTTVGDPTTYKTATDTGYWNPPTGITAAGTTWTISAYGFTDLAGNPGGTLASPVRASCTVGAASATGDLIP